MNPGRAHVKSNALSLRNLSLQEGPLLQQSLSFMEVSGELGYCFASTQAEWDWLVSCVDPNAWAAQSLHSALLAHRGHYRYRLCMLIGARSSLHESAKRFCGSTL